MLNSPTPPSTTAYDINFYIQDSKRRAEYHRKNANNSLLWYNLLNIVGTFIMGVSGLTMTVLSVEKINEGTVAIVSGSFTCLSLIFSRVSQSYNFQALSIEHHHCADSFLELVKDFSLITTEQNEAVYLLLVSKYVEVVERSHVQSVKKPCCCVL